LKCHPGTLASRLRLTGQAIDICAGFGAQARLTRDKTPRTYLGNGVYLGEGFETNVWGRLRHPYDSYRMGGCGLTIPLQSFCLCLTNDLAIWANSTHRNKTSMKQLVIWLTIIGASFAAVGSERFASTVGTVQREVIADSVTVTVEVKARDKTIKESNAQVEHLLRDLYAQVVALHYPTSSVTVEFRLTQLAKEHDGKKYVAVGFDSVASVSMILKGLSNYDELVTYLGTRDGFRIVSQSLKGSTEGQVRLAAVGEALKAARAKAQALASEGGTRLGKLLEVTEETVDWFESRTSAGNAIDPNEGKAPHGLSINVRVKAKFELVD
jgi:uncharacterized protein YggE